MDDILKLTLGQIIGHGAGILLILAMCIEITPIKFNPLSSILAWIGKKTNRDVIKRMSVVEESVTNLSEKMEAMQAEDDRQAAIGARTRILRFGDEILRDVEHTKDYFDSILKDAKMYEDYCRTHPTFENGVTEPTIQRIKEVYHDRLVKNDFLK